VHLKPKHFKMDDKTRSAKEITLDLYFPTVGNFPEDNMFNCTAKNHVGEDEAEFRIKLIEREFPYAIVVPIVLLCVIGIIVLVALISRKYFQKVRHQVVTF